MAALLEGGDVEALPFIALALERQQVLESEFEAKLALQPLPVQPQREAGEGLVRQTSSSSSAGGGAGGIVGVGAGSPTVDHASATYHTHQHISGSLVFLHPICTKCLLDASHTTPSDASTSTPVGSQVRGKVLEIEHLRVSADSRQRYTVLRHLPLHSEVTFVEIDVAPLVPPQVLSKYSEELHKRANKRRERVKQEKREKRLEQDQL
jgi:putative alpha-1,2-mannosidase